MICRGLNLMKPTCIGFAASRVGTAVNRSQRAGDSLASTPGWQDPLPSEGHIGPPLSDADRMHLRAHIGGSWSWASALPDLAAAWHNHGWGLAGRHTVLRWEKGALQAQPGIIEGTNIP